MNIQALESIEEISQGTKEKILVVDDEEPVCQLFARILEANGYTCALAANAVQAHKYLAKEQFDLLLCDIKMPGESGLELAQDVLSAYPETAVVMVTGVGDPEITRAALEIGAFGYITKPLDHNGVLFSVSNALRRRRLEMESRARRQNLERVVEARTAELREREARLRHTLDSLKKTIDGIIYAMALAIEMRDPYTAGHQRRVADLGRAIAGEMGLSEDRLEAVRIAGLLHDLGKISVPAAILSKPGRLSEAEFAIIKSHAQVGYEILREIEFPWPLAEIVHQHHERLDGSGYPQGLAGEEIFLEARIIGVADVVEAMASHRPYRPAVGIDAALEEISKKKDVLYDPEVVDACLRLFRERGFEFS